MLTAPPPGFRPLAEYCRENRIRRDVAAKAANAGRVEQAVKVHPPGAPHPVWFIPVSCHWKPYPKGYYPRPPKPQEDPFEGVRM